MINQLEDAKENLKNAKNCGGQAIDATLSAKGDPSLLKQEQEAVEQKYGDLLEQLKDKEAKLEKAVEQGTQIQEKLDDVEAWEAESSPLVESWEPISTDPRVAEKQLQQLEVSAFRSKSFWRSPLVSCPSSSKCSHVFRPPFYRSSKLETTRSLGRVMPSVLKCPFKQFRSTCYVAILLV